MTQLGPAQVGQFLRWQDDELVRIWRLARASARPDVFPGLLDGLAAAFFDRAGELLQGGAAPEEVWRGLAGLVRWPPALAPAELAVEWGLVEEVLTATCESVNAAPDVRDWLLAATGACRAGAARLRERGAGPGGVLTAVLFSRAAPPPPRPGAQEPVS